MRCVRCFRPLTSEKSIGNGMTGSTCKKYINAMSPSARAQMYQAFQEKMEKYGESGQTCNVDYSHLSKGAFEVTTSIYDQQENELVVSYRNKETGEVTSVRFHAEEGKPMYDYEKGTVEKNVVIGSARDDEIRQQDPNIGEVANDYVSVQASQEPQSPVQHAEVKDLSLQYSIYEDDEFYDLEIDHIHYYPTDKSYSLSFTEDGTPVKVEVYAEKEQMMGVKPVRYRLEKNGKVYEGFVSHNDANWTMFRQDHDILNRLHYDTRDTISNEMDFDYTVERLNQLNETYPDGNLIQTEQYEGFNSRFAQVKLAYFNPDTKEQVMVVESYGEQHVVRLYEQERTNRFPYALLSHDRYCYSVHGNGTQGEGTLSDGSIHNYQEQWRPVNQFVKDYEENARLRAENHFQVHNESINKKYEVTENDMREHGNRFFRRMKLADSQENQNGDNEYEYKMYVDDFSEFVAETDGHKTVPLRPNDARQAIERIFRSGWDYAQNVPQEEAGFARHLKGMANQGAYLGEADFKKDEKGQYYSVRIVVPNRPVVNA